MHQRLTNKKTHTQKEMFDNFVDKLGIDPKEDKESVKELA